MKQIFEAAWSLMNIKITYEGFTFSLWKPLAFGFIITLILRLLLQKSKED